MKIFKKPKICVPFVGRDLTELTAECDAYAALKSNGVMVEWRADRLADADAIPAAADLLRQRLPDTEKIFTLRADYEGGHCLLGSQERLDIIAANLSGFAYADIEAAVCQRSELSAAVADISRTTGAKVILSRHDFKGTPALPVIEKIVRQMTAIAMLIDAYAIKTAFTPKSEKDVLNLLEVALDFRAEYSELELIVISMGTMGKISRVFPLSAIAYGALLARSADGQMPVEGLVNTVNLLYD